jgi:hypothetical protein
MVVEEEEEEKFASTGKYLLDMLLKSGFIGDL